MVTRDAASAVQRQLEQKEAYGETCTFTVRPDGDDYIVEVLVPDAEPWTENYEAGDTVIDGVTVRVKHFGDVAGYVPYQP